MGERRKEGHQGRKIREWEEEEEEKCVLIKAAEEEKWVEDKEESTETGARTNFRF